MNQTLSGDVQFSGGEVGISQCVWCRHRSAVGGRCRAFPNGIPDAIARNRHDHRSPYAGDNGVRFEHEVIEIEFVGVESRADSVSLKAELAVAVAKVGGGRKIDEEPDDSADQAAMIINLDGVGYEVDDELFDLGVPATK